jgi:hypothetical protein
MSNAEKIKQAEARARRAETRALDLQILLALARAKSAERELQNERELNFNAERAVRLLYLSGKITTTFQQHEYKAAFLNEPSLIPLATGHVFNRKPKLKTHVQPA